MNENVLVLYEGKLTYAVIDNYCKEKTIYSDIIIKNKYNTIYASPKTYIDGLHNGILKIPTLLDYYLLIGRR